MSKRVLTTQQKFTPQVSDNLRKVMINSADLVDAFNGILEAAESGKAFEYGKFPY